MNFAIALVIYIVVFLLLLWATMRLETTLFTGVTVSALLSAILLALLVPFPEIDQHVNHVIDGVPHKDSLDAMVWTIILIYILTIILVTWYVVGKTLDEANTIFIHQE